MKKSAHRTKKIMLIAGDVVLLYASLWLALALRYGSSFTDRVWDIHFTPFSVAFGAWIVIFYIAGLYEPRASVFNLEQYTKAAKAMLAAMGTTVFLFYLVPAFGIAPKTNLILTGIFFTIGFLIWRGIWDAATRSQRLLHTIICVGTNKEMEEMIALVRAHPQLGWRIADTIIHENDLHSLPDRVKKHKADLVVYTEHAFREHISHALYALVPLGIRIADLPTFYAHLTQKIPISIIGEAWFLENLIEREKDTYEIVKRNLDALCACAMLLVLLPFLPLIAFAILLDSPGSVFYTQTRVGKNGRIFRVLKFRTMVADAESKGAQWTSRTDHRVTRVGRLLRKMRIDEIPQLWNIVIGDMSFIGPRPERPEFVAQLEKEVPHYQMRHLVRPGLTGWAQIHEPHSGASVKDTIGKLRYDLYYVKYRSLAMDLDIILKTIPVILTREGH